MGRKDGLNIKAPDMKSGALGTVASLATDSSCDLAKSLRSRFSKVATDLGCVLLVGAQQKPAGGSLYGF